MPVHRTAAEDGNDFCHLANGTGGDLQGTVPLACGELGGSPRRLKNPPTPRLLPSTPPAPSLRSCSQTSTPPTHLCRRQNSQPAKRGQTGSHTCLWPMADTVGQSDMRGKRTITCGCTTATHLSAGRQASGHSQGFSQSLPGASGPPQPSSRNRAQLSTGGANLAGALWNLKFF